MGNDKATAWLTLADADAVEQKVLDTIAKALMESNALNQGIMYRVVDKLCVDFNFQMRIKNMVEPIIRQTMSDEMRNNFKVEHYYEQYNRQAGYRISYGQHVITQQNIKIGF
jgi:hypothetical protein